MQDQPFEQVARAFVPMRIGLGAGYNQRISNQTRIDDQGLTVAFEKLQRIEAYGKPRKPVSGDTKGIDNTNPLSEFAAPRCRGVGQFTFRIEDQYRAVIFKQRRMQILLLLTESLQRLEHECRALVDSIIIGVQG